MHRLRNTFTRSRTPTGAEMKTQSSLEVPKQVRSASFDEIQLEAQRSLSGAPPEESSMSSVGNLLLQVPQTAPGQRSRSFDLAGSASDEGSAVAAAFLDVPKRFQRRKSSSKTPPPCIHCLYLEEYRRLIGVEQRLYYDSEEYQAYAGYYTSSSCSSDDDDDDDDGDGEEDATAAAAAAADAAGVAGGAAGGGAAGGSGGTTTADSKTQGDDEAVAGPSTESVNRVAAVGLTAGAGADNLDDGYYNFDYFYDDDDDDDDDDEDDEDEPVEQDDDDDSDSDAKRRKERRAPTATTPTTGTETASFGLEAPAYDYASLFQRVSPRRRPRVDCECDTGAVATTLLEPTPAITLTLTTTKADDEVEPNRDGGNVTHTTGEIALMLPHHDDPQPEQQQQQQQQQQQVTGEPEADPATGEAVVVTTELPSNRTRRRSISRQEAIIVEPTGSSLENVSGTSESRPTSPTPPPPPQPTTIIGVIVDDPLDNQARPPQRGRAASMGPSVGAAPSSSFASPPPLPPYPCQQPPAPPVPPRPGVPVPLESPPPVARIITTTVTASSTTAADFVRDIYLQVPDLKRDRAASVDSCFAKVTGAKTEELQPPADGVACLNLLTVPSSGAVRSRSVDIVLPTEEQARYKALALAGPSGSGAASGGGPGPSNANVTAAATASIALPPGVRG
uniref:Eye-specific diacylglycerol kinase n=1 Tax=Anopheles farauti TaxID=69004 RepID=A0A182QZK4_9DIPT